MPHTHEEFESEEIAFTDYIFPDQLIDQMRKLQALRVKGVVQTSEGLRLVQGVGPRVDLVIPPTNLPSEIVGRIVSIRRK